MLSHLLIKIKKGFNFFQNKRNIAWLDSFLLKSHSDHLEFICKECLTRQIDFTQGQGALKYEEIFLSQLHYFFATPKNHTEPDIDLPVNVYSVLKKIIDLQTPPIRKLIVKHTNSNNEKNYELETMHYSLYSNFCLNKYRPKLEHILVSSLSNYSMETLQEMLATSQLMALEKRNIMAELLHKTISLKDIYKMRQEKKQKVQSKLHSKIL